MSKKKRVFDIDFDEENVSVPAGTDGTETRRGPMAAAISENAEALTERQKAEDAIRVENDALAHEHVRLKKAGLITDLLPLDAIKTSKLTRDRRDGRDDEIDDLKKSIREIGLSNPIRVEKTGDSYELIQGFRRLTAYRELFAETGSDEFAKIPSGINAVGEDLLKLYRRMVDENLVRRGVSFGEMAQLAINYRSEDPNLDGYDGAVELLYASSGRQRRSYIKSFVRLLGLIGDDLKFPEALSRAQGLNLLKRLEDREGQVHGLRRMLAQVPDRDAEQEQDILGDFINQTPVAQASVPKVKLAPKAAAKTTFRLDRPEGIAKCTVADGRVELKLDRDFSGVERQKLEAALAAFFDILDD
jgi:ParB family chromosome partitioning protein